MKQCPICNELLGDNVEVCFKCRYNFVLGRRQTAKERTIDSTTKEQESQRRLEQIEQNNLYEYKVEIINDEKDGTLNKHSIQEILTKNAQLGWRLHSITTNEIGKQVGGMSIPFLSMSLNATIEQTVLVFERCIRVGKN